MDTNVRFVLYEGWDGNSWMGVWCLVCDFMCLILCMRDLLGRILNVLPLGE